MNIQLKVFRKKDQEVKSSELKEEFFIKRINDFLSKIDGQDIVFINAISDGNFINSDVVYIFYKQYEGNPRV